MWPHGNIFSTKGHILFIFFWICGHSMFTVWPVMNRKVRKHVTLPGQLSEILEAAAALDGRSLSDLLTELGRDYAKTHGLIKPPTAEDIAALKKRGTK